MNVAFVTHGHPDGWLPGGVLAATVHRIVHEGASLRDAASQSLHECRFWPHNKGTAYTLWAAVETDTVNEDNRYQKLGGGWKGHEALAQALHSCLHADTFEEAVLSVTSFGGDHDTVGCIAGCLYGAYVGYSSLPQGWCASVPVVRVATELAADMYLRLFWNLIDFRKYPPN